MQAVKMKDLQISGLCLCQLCFAVRPANCVLVAALAGFLLLDTILEFQQLEDC